MLLNDGFPFQLDVVVNNSSILELFSAILEYEQSPKIMLKAALKTMPKNLLSKIDVSAIDKAPQRKISKLNLGLYQPQKKVQGEVISPARVLKFYLLSHSHEPKEIILNDYDLYPKRYTPTRMSMQTSQNGKSNNGTVVIIPNNIAIKTKMVVVFCGYKYGSMMGHGSRQIWRKNEQGWRLSSSRGTWIS